MNLSFQDQGWEDLQYWITTDAKIAKKLIRLINASLNDPYKGIGKPEPLRYEFSGYWSRRINEEHRLVYTVVGEDLVIVQARYHYKK